LRGIHLNALQISGIGYKKVDFFGPLPKTIGERSFFPPSSENYIEAVPGTLMSTSYARNGKKIELRPEYRAFGTYTAPELREKLKKTIEASKLNLENMVVSPVEAYGQYLNDDLKNKDGNFGFMVIPVPSLHKTRVASEVAEKFIEVASGGVSMVQASTGLYFLLSLNIASLMHGLRELHDKHRKVYLQAHLSNYYVVDGKPYLMDWATMENLGEDRENNIVSRCLDMLKPVDNYRRFFTQFFGGCFSQNLMDNFCKTSFEVAMQVYSRDLEREFNLLDWAKRAEDLRGDYSDLSLAIQWMKDQGIEGFEKFQPKPFVLSVAEASRNSMGILGGLDSLGPLGDSKKKAGRNEPCPCGSGKKYKKCCLHN